MGMDGGNPAVPRQRYCHRVRPWQCHLPPSAPTHPELISLTAETLLLNATQAVTIKQTPKFRFGIFFSLFSAHLMELKCPKLSQYFYYLTQQSSAQTSHYASVQWLEQCQNSSELTQFFT